MTVTIKKSIANGTAVAPPSKSMAHRYLICGALSEKSEINNVDFSNDIKVTLDCLKALGANSKISGDTVTIGGIDFNSSVKKNKLFCGESGSTLRFLIPICLLFSEEITLYGTERLFSRSLSVYEDICKAQDLMFCKTKNSVTVKGKLKSGKYTVRGDISSQFISGLMFALSKLEEDSVIEITDGLESGSYLDLTVKALADFGVRINRPEENVILVAGNQTYKKRNITVEGDYSNAAFLEAFNLIGGCVSVEGLDKNSFQGDRVYKQHFLSLKNGYCTIDLSDCPDLAPILMTAAALLNGAHFTGTKRLRIKESDRGEAMRAELQKFGGDVTVEENSITVKKVPLIASGVPLFGHNDHRIVMSMALLASYFGGEIVGAEAVAKSYPDFFDAIKKLGIDIKVNKK